MNKVKQTILYHLLTLISLLISIIGYIGLKLTIVAMATGIAILTEKYIGNLGLSIGWISGLMVGSLLFIGLQCLYPYLERLDEKAKTYKSYPFTEKYGSDYPHPKPKDFG